MEISFHFNGKQYLEKKQNLEGKKEMKRKDGDWSKLTYGISQYVVHPIPMYRLYFDPPVQRCSWPSFSFALISPHFAIQFSV